MADFLVLGGVLRGHLLPAGNVHLLNLAHGTNFHAYHVAVDMETGVAYANTKDFIDDPDKWIEVGKIDISKMKLETGGWRKKNDGHKV